RANVFKDNAVVSTVPAMIHSSKDLKLSGNTWWYTGTGVPSWQYDGLQLAASPGSGERIGDARIERLLTTPPVTAVPPKLPAALRRRSNHWLLAMFVDPESREDRSNAVWLQTALAQYGDRNLDGAVLCAKACEDLSHDWHLTGAQVLKGMGSGTWLISPEGKVVARWNGFIPPSEIGFAVRWHVGGWRPPMRRR
ncbi:MAG: hypothetical protein ABIQ44_12035, partial [Chloroflexia bacterium]